jgi:hypothetical protein
VALPLYRVFSLRWCRMLMTCRSAPLVLGQTGQTPGQVMMPGVYIVTWWCMVPFLVHSSTLPQVTRF